MTCLFVVRRALPMLCVVALSGFASYAGAEDDNATSLSALPRLNPVQDAHVTLEVLPVYPARAMRKGIDADVTVSFEISKYGRAVNARIRSDSSADMFVDDVLDALDYWSFIPARPLDCGTKAQQASLTFRFRHRDKEPVQVLPILIEGRIDVPPGIRPVTDTAIIHAMQDQARNYSPTEQQRRLVVRKRVEPVYPERALARKAEGIVAMTFTVSTDGSVSDINVVDSVKGALFKAPAMRALNQWRFEPFIEDGQPVERLACHEFVFHIDDRKFSQQARRERERTRSSGF